MSFVSHSLDSFFLKHLGNQYCPSSESGTKRNKFYEWYNSVKGGVFDMNKEVNEYCESDVYMYLAEVPAKFDDMYCDIT